MICVFSVLVNYLISFVSTGGTKSGGAAADGKSGGKSGVSGVSKKLSGYAAGCKKNALKVSKQSSVCTARCGDQFDIRSPPGMHNCIVVNNFFSSVFEP